MSHRCEYDTKNSTAYRELYATGLKVAFNSSPSRSEEKGAPKRASGALRGLPELDRHIAAVEAIAADDEAHEH
jgi:hypothetical protein